MERSRSDALRVVFSVLVVIGLMSSSQVLGEGEAADPVAVSSGVYTEEQADVGEAAFARHCASCHGLSLEGGFGPTLAPLDPWQFSGGPLSRPFDIMRREMPFDAPGSLDEEVYLAILAFVLRENGFVSGEDPLVTDEDGTLEGYLLDLPAAD